MATGTGLPIPKSGVLAQSPGMVSGDQLFSAQAWTSIAKDGEQIASEGERMVKQSQVGAIADFENRAREKYVRLADENYGFPDKFDAAARGHNDGVLGSIHPSMVEHARRFNEGLRISGLNQQFAVRRSKDERFASEALENRIKLADRDWQEAASSANVSTDQGVASGLTFRGVVESAVATGSMTRERADLLIDDAATRAEGSIVRVGLEDIYEKEGFEKAREWLSTKVRDMGVATNTGDKYERAGLAWLRSQESAHRGERDAIRREWTAAKGQAATLPPETLDDLASRAYEVGNIRVGQDIEATSRGLRIAASARSLPLTDRVAVVTTGEVPSDNLESRLRQRESGGNVSRVNQWGYAGLYQFGAPRLSDLGVYSPGTDEDLKGWSTRLQANGKWSGSFRIPGFPDVNTIEEFRRNPEAQRAVYALHVARMDQEIADNDLARFEGQTIGGVTITRDGMRAMMHLGGAAGTRRTLESGGSVNPADLNGTSLLDYAKLGGAPAAPGAGTNLTQSREGLLALRTIKQEMAGGIDRNITELEAANRRSEFPALDEITALGAQVAAVGTPEQKRKVAELAVIADAGSRFQTMSPPAREAAIARWSKEFDESAPTFSRKIEETLTSANRKISESYKTDPYGAAARFSEGLPAASVIDFASPTAKDQINERTKLGNTISARENLPAFSVLRPTEADDLAARLTQGNTSAIGPLLQIFSQLPPEQRAATFGDKKIADALVGMTHSLDPIRMNAGMSVLDREWRVDPTRFKSVYGNETMSRLQVWQSLLPSLRPEEIVERLKRADDPAMVKARETLASRAAEETKPLTSSELLRQAFGSKVPFSSAPEAVTETQADSIRAEFEIAYADLRTYGVPREQARTQAIERLKTSWSVSHVNGGRVMRNAPDKYYPAIDGSYEWMRQQITLDIAKTMGVPSQTSSGGEIQYKTNEGLNPYWDYTLVADSNTEAEVRAGVPPTYLVMITDYKVGRRSLMDKRFRFDDIPDVEARRARFNASRRQILSLADDPQFTDPMTGFNARGSN